MNSFQIRRFSTSWELVAHACNPSYSGGRDHEDQGSKPALANSSRDLILKVPNTKKGLVAQAVDCLPSKCEALSTNSSTAKKKKKTIQHNPSWSSLAHCLL
jgi:hypothetical protein